MSDGGKTNGRLSRIAPNAYACSYARRNSSHEISDYVQRARRVEPLICG